MSSLHTYPTLHTAERLQLTINQNVDHLDYLRQQVQLIDLKIKNLRVIQADQSLTGEDERQAVQVILKLVKNNDVESLKNILRELL
jgi:hypothetical protein